MTRRWNKKLPKIAQKVAKSFFKIRQEYFEYFCKKMYYQEVQKIAQFGHTDARQQYLEE